MKPVDYRVSVDEPSKQSTFFVELIGKQGEAYLWIGDLNGHHVATLIGAATLHRLADAIHKHVPDLRQQGRRSKKGKRR